MTSYTLYVMSNSPYSDKIRMYLRLKRLPVVEVRENMRNREQVLRARAGSRRRVRRPRSGPPMPAAAASTR